MGPAIPIVAVAAGAAASTAVAAAVGTGIVATLAGAVAGFAVTSAVNALGSSLVGSRSVSSKPIAGANTADAARGITVMSRNSVESHKIVYGETRVSGPIVLITTTNSGPDSDGTTKTGDNIFLHMVVALAGHEVEEISTIYLNEQAVTLNGGGFVQTAPYLKDGKSYVRVKKYTGTTSQTADPDLMSEFSSWTSAHRLQGIAYVYVRMQYNADVFPNGLPNVSALVKGKKIYDPRTGSTAWTDNAALCVRDYLVSDYGFGCSSDEVNDTYFNAAANICEESVSLSTGGSQDRYTTNGVIDTAAGPLDNLNALVAAMAGAVTYVQGKFRGYAGAYDSPVGSIDLDMVVDEINVVTDAPRNELFNRVQGTFVDPNKNYQPTDFPPVTNATYEAEDGGEVIPRDVVLTLTNHPERAQRIAKILLEQGRQGIQVELKLKHDALQFAVWDTVTLDNAPLGWSSKVFRIKELQLDGIGPITVMLQEESSASYDWNNGEAQTYDAAPDTNLPSPFTVAAPSGLSVTEELYVTRSAAGVKAKAILEWVASSDVFLNQYQPEYKLSTDSSHKVLARTSSTTAEILDIEPGLYDFRVKAINSLGASSAYTTDSRQIAGLSAPPTAPQNLYWTALGGIAYLNWTPSTDLDVLFGGYYEFRFSPTTTDGWGRSASIGSPVSGNNSQALLPLKPGIYLVKAVDASGIKSTTASSVIVTQDTILDLKLKTTVTEDPTFGGTKTNCSVSSGSLTITNTASPATYLFANDMDFGAVSRVRIRSIMNITIVDPTDLIDSRTELIDDWEDIDNSEVGAGDAVVFIRTTQDDPTGSPTWTDWRRLDAGEFECWGAEFKVEMQSFDESYTVQIDALAVRAEEL